MAEAHIPGRLGEILRSIRSSEQRLSGVQPLTVLIIRLHDMYQAFDNPGKEVIFLDAFANETFPILHQHEGTIETVAAGHDAIKVFFGAPDMQPDHALKAVQAALELRPTLEEFKEIKSGVHIGIGINTEPMFYGNVGSSERFDFGVMGDAVRRCYIMADATQALGYGILIGENTFLQVRDSISATGPISLIVREHHNNTPLRVYGLGPSR